MMQSTPLRFALMLLAIFLMTTTGRAEAAARAFLDRSSITMGETVTLNIEIDGMGNVQPDLAPLDNSFRLLGTSSSSQLNLVNGRQTARQLWAVALEPLNEGVIGIPALTVGSEQTEPLTLTVLPAPQGASGAAGDDVFLEVDALPLDPYVQQQVRYVVRLHYAVNLAEGQLDEPQADGARLQRLGSDTRYQKRIADRRYEVIERRYALIPERSGRVEISQPRFRGAAIDGTRGGFFGSGRRLQASGPAVTLDVQPRPVSAAEPWLPALALALDDESGELSGPLRVGEPLTLSIRLSARGLAADQLPELELPAIDGAQIYPDVESSQTGDSGEWLSGERVRRFAVVPSRSGRIEIPAIRVRWWNVETDSEQVAEIAARTIEVGAALVGGVEPTPGAADSASSQGASEAGDIEPSTASRSAGIWPWISAALAALWLATLVLCAHLWRRRTSAHAPLNEVAASRRHTSLDRASVRRALESGDLSSLAQQIRDLAPEGPRASLESVAQRLEDAEQVDALRQLERWLYRDRDPERRAELIRTLRAALQRPLVWSVTAKRPAGDDDLPPLFAASPREPQQ